MFSCVVAQSKQGNMDELKDDPVVISWAVMSKNALFGVTTALRGLDKSAQKITRPRQCIALNLTPTKTYQ
jgi:hypothetical protein